MNPESVSFARAISSEPSLKSWLNARIMFSWHWKRVAFVNAGVPMSYDSVAEKSVVSGVKTVFSFCLYVPLSETMGSCPL